MVGKDVSAIVLMSGKHKDVPSYLNQESVYQTYASSAIVAVEGELARHLSLGTESSNTAAYITDLSIFARTRIPT